MIEFYGYERPDGSVGIRNHLLVIAPIDCSYEPAKQVAAQVEGAVAITQTYGCGHDDMVLHNLVGTALNPNVAGVLILGLGYQPHLETRPQHHDPGRRRHHKDT